MLLLQGDARKVIKAMSSFTESSEELHTGGCPTGRGDAAVLCTLGFREIAVPWPRTSKPFQTESTREKCGHHLAASTWRNTGVLSPEKTALAVNHMSARSAETSGGGAGEDGQGAEGAWSLSAPAQGCSSPSSQKEALGSQVTTLFLSTYLVRS